MQSGTKGRGGEEKRQREGGMGGGSNGSRGLTSGSTGGVIDDEKNRTGTSLE